MTRLTLHRRVHLASDDKVTTSAFVRCAEDGHWSPVEACRRCSKCDGVNGTAVTCDPAPATPPNADPEHAPITEVMDADVLCIDARATLESARHVMNGRDTSIAVVVDVAAPSL